MKKTISLRVNGLERSAEVEPRMTLLELVREALLTGAKLGVTFKCAAPVRSCLTASR